MTGQQLDSIRLVRRTRVRTLRRRRAESEESPPDTEETGGAGGKRGNGTRQMEINRIRLMLVAMSEEQQLQGVSPPGGKSLLGESQTDKAPRPQ